MGVSYEILFTENADKDLEFWKRSGQKVIQKRISALLSDIKAHPKTGIGKPEELRFDLSGFWSRRINAEHRIVYTIDELSKKVFVHQLRGHYMK